MSREIELNRCPCPPPDDDDDDMEICYVEGSKIDKKHSVNLRQLTESIWKGLNPPIKYHVKPAPLVTARKIDIMRATISGKAKPKFAQVSQSKNFCDGFGISRTSTRINYDMNMS